MTKQCTKCLIEKTLTEFSLRRDGVRGRQSHCKLCRRATWKMFNTSNRARQRARYAALTDAQHTQWRESSKRYRDKHSDRLKEQHRKKHQEIRQSVLTKYGGLCCCCGETQWKFLVIDHIGGGGNAERKALGGTTMVYRKLYTSNELLEGYRVLCHNCNMASSFYGSCPHLANS